MVTETGVKLRQTAQATAKLGTTLRTSAMRRHYVSQPSEIELVGLAVSDAMACQETANSLGLEQPWAELIAAAHELHYEMAHRTREPESLNEGSNLITLIDNMTFAAQRADIATEAKAI